MSPGERVVAWRPAVPGVAEVFHAHFVEHRYPPHHHDTWAVLIVDDGAIRYDLEGRHRGGDTASVTILPPGVVHDGRAASAVGFSKRVLYLDTGLVPAGLAGRGVDRSAVADAGLRRALSRLHFRLLDGDGALDGEERVDWIARRLRRHLGAPPVPLPSGDAGDARRLRDYLAARAFEPVTLADAGAELDRSVAYLARTFRAAYALSPHTFVVGLRVARARRLLLEGWSPAAAAVEAGFYDQAHLHRHFLRHVGTTPGRFRSGPECAPPGG